MQLIHKGQSLGQPVPTIGANGNWFIEGQDTGIKADASKIDRGTLTGDISVLDTATEPGVYTWVDNDGTFGGGRGTLWNIKVEAPLFDGVHQSITQTAISTYATFRSGVVKVRGKYYANNNNGSQWSPWITLANTTQTSNPNLIRNWYFQKGVTLNQRGKEEWRDGDIYTIDGWKVQFAAPNPSANDNILMRLTDDGLEMGSDPANPNGINIFYPLEDAIRDALKNRKITFSVLTYSGEFKFRTLTVPATLPGTDNAGSMTQDVIVFDKIIAHTYCYSGWSSGNMGLIIRNRFDDGSTHFDTVRAVKLEMGDHQTLCRQDINGKWVLNDPPPDPGELLRWGQRYLRVLQSGDRVGQIGSMKGDEPIPIDTYISNMRITPTMNGSGVKLHLGSTVYDASDFKVAGGTGVRGDVVKVISNDASQAAFYVGVEVIVGTDSTANLIFSAEL